MSLSRKILIASGKGGVGKTTLAVNLGKALARKKQRVVVVDMDFCLNNVDIFAQVEDRIVFDLADCIDNRCRVKQALLQDRTMHSLYVLPSNGSGRAQMSAQGVTRITEELSSMFDYCIFDCPAGMGEDFDVACKNSEEAICVCTQHLTSLRDCARVLSHLPSDIVSRYLVLNRYRPDLAKKKKLLNANQVFTLLPEVMPIGIVPEDESLDCLDSDSITELYFDVIAENLHNGTDKIFTFEKGKKTRC